MMKSLVVLWFNACLIGQEGGLVSAEAIFLVANAGRAAEIRTTPMQANGLGPVMELV